MIDKIAASKRNEIYTKFIRITERLVRQYTGTVCGWSHGWRWWSPGRNDQGQEALKDMDANHSPSIQDLDCFWTKNKVEELGNPTSWRIVQQCNEGDSTEKNEVIFTVQGIIASKALPPLTEKPRYVKRSAIEQTTTNNAHDRTPAAKYKFLRQSVTLSGLGTPTFENAMIAARDVHKRFDRHFAEGTLEPWTELDAGDQTSLSLDISNRYFTPRGEAHGLNHKEFLPGVDPRGILSDLAKGDGITSYVHTEDNQVLYFTAYRDREGTRK